MSTQPTSTTSPSRLEKSVFHQGELEFQRKAHTLEFANHLGSRKITSHVPEEYHPFLMERFVVFVASFDAEQSECWCSSIWATPKQHEVYSKLNDSEELTSYLQEKDTPWIPLNAKTSSSAESINSHLLCSLYDPCNVSSGEDLNYKHHERVNQSHFNPLISISKDGSIIRILKAPTENDPMWKTCSQVGALVSLNFLDLCSRKRYRTNGEVIEPLSEEGFSIRVKEAFSTCPKYIQQRAVQSIIGFEDWKKSTIAFDNFSSEKMPDNVVNFMLGSDTMMISTVHLEKGADCSHRGGRPGFIRIIDRDTLVWGDYIGKGMFQTLGNTENCPSAGLLFIDFDHGHVLQLTGKIRVEWREEQGIGLDGSDRTVIFNVEKWKVSHHQCPFKWDFISTSSHNPLLNDSNELEKLNPYQKPIFNVAPIMKEKHLGEIVHAKLVSVKKVTDEISSFGFEILEGHRSITYLPGQYATFTLSLDHPYMRSWTITSALYLVPPSKDGSIEREPSNEANQFEITVKKISLGKTSSWLHQDAKVGETKLFLMGIEGNFTLQTSYHVALKHSIDNSSSFKWKVLFLSGGIGITPFMSMIRGKFHSIQDSILESKNSPLVHWIHSEKYLNDIPFKSELDEYERKGIIQELNFCVTRMKEVSQSNVKCQRLDLNLLKELVPDVQERVVYVCGPSPFNESLIDILKQLKVPAMNILIESFDY